MGDRRNDIHLLADAIVQAWEQSPHQFDCTYQHQLQMALIAARFIVDIAEDEPKEATDGE